MNCFEQFSNRIARKHIEMKYLFFKHLNKESSFGIFFISSFEILSPLSQFVSPHLQYTYILVGNLSSTLGANFDILKMQILQEKINIVKEEIKNICIW